MLLLDDIEKKLNMKFPKEYEERYSCLIRLDNGVEICVGADVIKIQKFLKADEINAVLEEFYDFFGYDIVPIAETEWEDYICLCYKESVENPSIIYWDYELALENPMGGIFFLYDSMHEFVRNVLYGLIADFAQ